MHKNLKTTLMIGIPILLSCTLVKVFKPNTTNVNLNSREDVKYEAIVNSLFQDVPLEEAGVFLYTSNYKTRYLFATNTKILNPISNVEHDSFFPTLLKYNKDGICTVIRTSDLPSDSSLYSALDSKSQISNDHFYMACPIFTKGGILAGYLSQVFVNTTNGVVANLQKLKHYTKIIEFNLQNII